jgi:hypothetical protein
LVQGSRERERERGIQNIIYNTSWYKVLERERERGIQNIIYNTSWYKVLERGSQISIRTISVENMVNKKEAKYPYFNFL